MRALPVQILAFSMLMAACVSTQAYTAKTIYSFCTGECTDGEQPIDVIVDGSGTLYGVTESGGLYNGGAAFALVPNAKRTKWTYKRIWSFCNPNDCKEGFLPNNGLIMDTAGNLYGATDVGGDGRSGALYRLSRKAKRWKLDVIYDFCTFADCADGAPTMRLTYRGASSGALYDGTSPLYAGNYVAGNEGAVFSVTPTGHKGLWTGKLVYAFCQKENCTDGANVEALMADSAGNLFGTTANGGKEGVGEVFELSSDGSGGWTNAVLHNFCASCTTDGGIPNGQIAFDASGALYGALLQHGLYGQGAIFKLSQRGTKWKEDVLYNLCPGGDCAKSGAAVASMVLDSEGNLFGAASWFGAHGGGTAFALDPNFEVLHDFCNCDGDGTSPASIAMDPAGNLYGATIFGGDKSMGTIFEIEK